MITLRDEEKVRPYKIDEFSKRIEGKKLRFRIMSRYLFAESFGQVKRILYTLSISLWVLIKPLKSVLNTFQLTQS